MSGGPDHYDKDIYRFGWIKHTTTGGFPDFYIDEKCDLKGRKNAEQRSDSTKSLPPSFEHRFQRSSVSCAFGRVYRIPMNSLAP